MSLTMLVEDEGRNYIGAEYEQWLTETGFRNPRRIPPTFPAPTVPSSPRNHEPGQPILTGRQPGRSTGGRAVQIGRRCHGEKADPEQRLGQRG
jgi:hypothetical protein